MITSRYEYEYEWYVSVKYAGYFCHFLKKSADSFADPNVGLSVILAGLNR